MSAELQFITKDQCGLCDEALAKLRPLAKWAGVEVHIRDIADVSDPGVAQRVPVLMVGDEELHSGPLTWIGAVRVLGKARFARS